MDKVFVVMSPASGEIFGGSYDKEAAEQFVPNLGPGPQVFAYGRGDDGKWNRQDAGLDERVEAGHDYILDLEESLGIDGIVEEALARQLITRQAQDFFQGANESKAEGSNIRQSEGAASSAFSPDEWADPAVRAAFRGDHGSYLAYKKAEAKGLICL